MAEGGKRRRNWSALWGAVWSGIFLIVLGYMLIPVFEKGRLTSPETWEQFGRQFLPILIVLIGFSVVGSGIIRWYTGETREEKR